jgi:hypothetical protein
VAVFVLEVLVGLAVLLGIALVATRDVRGLEDEPRDEPDIGLPAGRLLRSDDIDRLRFRAVGGLRGTIRGYRFADVDSALDAAKQALAAHEAAARPATRETP